MRQFFQVLVPPKTHFSSFYWKGLIMRHDKSWHEGVMFSCDQCDYKARLKGSLSKHMKSIHKGLQFGVARLFPTTIVTTYKCYYTICYCSKWQKWIIFIGNSFKWKITSNKRHIYLFPNLVKVFSTGFVRKKICGKHLR